MSVGVLLAPSIRRRLLDRDCGRISRRPVWQRRKRHRHFSLSLIGVPGFVAIAAPLPATIPGTFIASVGYWRAKLLDWQIVWWSIAFGIPATIAGSYLTKLTGAKPLLVVTGVMVLGFGLSFLLAPKEALPVA